MNKIVCVIIIAVAFSLRGYTQCGEDTYELALAKAGNDIVLVRDFKVKLREGNKRNPSPSGKYSVLMQKGLTYRFIIQKDKTSSIEPILQLFDRNEELGCTYNIHTSENLGRFEYRCSRTGNYQVYVSFKEAKAGCAIGVMAMVTDSSFYAQGNVKPVDERFNLYQDIETPLNIIAEQPNIKRIEMKSDRGNVYRKDSTWYALISETGPVKITVNLYNQSDSLVEKIEQEFNVVPLTKPTISIEGAEREYLNASMLGNLVRLVVKPSAYRIQEFYLSTELGYNSGLLSHSEYLTQEMITYLKSLPPQERFYIKDVRLITPGGTIVNIESVPFYVR